MLSSGFNALGCRGEKEHLLSIKFHSDTFQVSCYDNADAAQMLFSRHLSDPLLLTQNSNCESIEQQQHSMDGGIHP